jgi:hypothetical protein
METHYCQSKTGHEIPKVFPPPTILVDLAWSHNHHKNPNLASSRVLRTRMNSSGKKIFSNKKGTLTKRWRFDNSAHYPSAYMHRLNKTITAPALCQLLLLFLLVVTIVRASCGYSRIYSSLLYL